MNNATIGEILKQNGYATSWFGKNHNTPVTQYTTAGPFDQWPVGMGFDFTYDGPGIGKGGTGVLKADGKDVASRRFRTPCQWP